jgi:hypothetical protein
MELLSKLVIKMKILSFLVKLIAYINFHNYECVELNLHFCLVRHNAMHKQVIILL